MANQTPQKPADVIRGELRTLDSRISLIGQKISTIEKNEEVLGRTLLALTERVKNLERTGGGIREASGGGADTAEIKKELERLRAEMVNKQEIKELRYILDTINPLEYATISQVRELIRDEIKRRSSSV